MILFFCGSLTFPAKQQREMALWIMNLLDLKLGSLYSLGPKAKKKKRYKCFGTCYTIQYNIIRDKRTVIIEDHNPKLALGRKCMIL